MKKNNYRKLQPIEIEQLKNQNNRCVDWSKVAVAEEFNAGALYGNVLCGEVCLGVFDPEACVADGDLSLPEGISGSMLCSCEVGSHSAVYNVGMLSNYKVGEHCLLFNVDEMTCTTSGSYAWMEPMNENGGRRILPFSGMTIADAYLWARFRDHEKVMQRLEQMTVEHLQSDEGSYGNIGSYCVIKNCKELHNVAVNSDAKSPTHIIDCIVLSDGVVGYGCGVEYGCIAQRFLLGEHVHLEYGVRLNDTVVGDNSTVARCEVGNSIIFPAHEQHHNSSFLIAALVQGQSNLASGATVGSNHNGRTADNEIACGRGFWPGLCVSLKHSSRFASYILLAKGDYPHELNIMLPFALVNNNAAKNRLEVMPAYWWLYNMYALNRNGKKFAARDKRVRKVQHVEFDPFAPDTAEEIFGARGLLKVWTERSYMNATNTSDTIEIVAEGMENSRRKTVVLKAGAAYRAYDDMLVYYAMKNLHPTYGDIMPSATLGEGDRTINWVNLGGQLVPAPDMEQLLSDVEKGVLNSWEAIHQRLDSLWAEYPLAKNRHAYQMLCAMMGKKSLSQQDWQGYCVRYAEVVQYVEKQVKVSRQKDDDNPYRHITYWNDAERDAVMA